MIGCCIQPGFDHTSQWNKDGRPFAIVTQPYSISDATLRDWMRLCQELGLTFRMDAWNSWHYPAHTILVMFTRKGEKPK